MIIIDWSEWDNSRHPGIDEAWFFAQYDGVIVRVANENGYADRYAASNVDSARRSGKPWGVYAWPVVGWGFDQNFALGARLARDYADGVLGVAADAEHSPRGFASPDEVAGFCQGVQSEGRVSLYYCAINELQRTGYLDSLPWWVSDYDRNDGAYHDPWNQRPYPPDDRGYALHQFTSMGWPGGGSLDVSYCDNLAWAGAPAAPPTAQRPKENDLYIVKNVDTGQRVLYTALGATPDIDESFSNHLQMAGVSYYELHTNEFDSLGLIHIGHRNGLVQSVDDAISDEGGGGAPPQDITAIPRDDFAAETNRRLGTDELEIDGGPGATFVVT